MQSIGAVLRLRGLSPGGHGNRARKYTSRYRLPPAPSATLATKHDVTRHVHRIFSSYAVAPRGDAATTTVLFVHGGGFIGNISPAHWALIDRVVDAGVRVEAPLYGTAPHFRHDDALPFLVDVYRRVATTREDDSIVVMGDSSGAATALSLVQAVRELSLPMPTRSIFISPWLDLTLDNPELAEFERIDPWLSREALDLGARAWAPGEDLADPRISPIFGDLSGLPPFIVHIGTRDMLYPDALRFRDMAAAVGTTVDLQVCRSALHLFPFTPTPEGRAATAAIVDSVAADAPRTLSAFEPDVVGVGSNRPAAHAVQ